MGKKALRKDFYMEIRRSLGRFLSIFFIVAIGVAFFSGIRVSEPDMRYSADAYFDQQNLMDIEVISTMGLTDDDIAAVEAVDGIAAAEGGYSVDALCTEGDNQVVVHVMSLLPTMNQVQLEKGKMPEAADECVVDVDYLASGSLEIGDTITFSGGTDSEITDTLTTDTFTIVGAVSSPCYIGFERGSSTVGNGSVAGFVCVPEESFSLEVYTEIYAQVEGAKELTAFTDEYDSRIEEVLDSVEAIKEERQQARYQEVVDEANEALNDARQELTDAEQELEDGRTQAEQELADARKQLEDAEKELEDGRTELESSKEQLEASKKEIQSSKQELEARQKELEDGTEQLNQGIDELNASIDALNEAKDQYNTLAASGQTDDVTLATMNALYEQIQQGEAQIEAARAEIEASRAQLESGQEQINQGVSQIEEGEQQIADAEQQIEDAEAELADGEQEIADGWEEYYDGEKEAQEEIADGERQIADAKEKLADAEQEVADIEQPTWYVYDRDNLSDYSGYGDNADRMRAIGKVFPVIFFLVAALISLTTMTRMVEEQRTLIGTLKALGYEKHSIAGKYLGYACLATVSGSVLGILFGEKVFPYIIITAYGIMYQHMNVVVLPYSLEYGLIASVAALVCTIGATFFSCFRELREQAAELMRPPTPKQGQRVFLERFSFIWKRLNFSWKATVRNIVRYKKRFFMTVFGIGGCMALLLVGFGLKDSIMAIAVLQYEEIQLYDGNIILNEDASDEEKQEVLDMISSTDQVADAAENLLKQITIGNEWKDVYLNVPADVESYPDFVLLQDRTTKEQYFLDDDGVILTEKMAKELEIEAGDTITIRDEDKGDVDVTVEHICENYMGHYLYMTPALYEEMYGEAPNYNSVYYRTVDRTTEEAENVGEDVLQLDGALSVSYTTDLRQQVEDMLEALDLVIVVLILSAGMLAFVVLYNLNNINITERKRELATLKVLGFYNNEVCAYVYRENIILTLIGAVFGMALGRILHQFIIVTVEIDSVMFGRNINAVSYLYGFLITIAFSCIVNGVMYFKLKNINMVESLKSVE